MTIETVRGPVSVEKLERVLVHEHVLASAKYMAFAKYEDRLPAGTYNTLLEHLSPIYTRLREEFRCNTIVDVTPTGIGRNVDVLRRISEATSMNIVCCTGYYTTRGRPGYFEQRPAAELADTMIAELTDGIGGTGVKAGVIKIGVGNWDRGDRLLCRAAAIAQQATGCSITTHTCTPLVRRGVLDFLEGAGVPPDRICIGHADANGTIAESLELVRRGCSLIFTIWGIQDRESIGWQPPVLPRYHSAELMAALVAEGYKSQVMASIDYAPQITKTGSLRTDHLYGVEGRTTRYLFTHVLGWLSNLFGIQEKTIECILRENPVRSLVPR